MDIEIVVVNLENKKEGPVFFTINEMSKIFNLAAAGKVVICEIIDRKSSPAEKFINIFLDSDNHAKEIKKIFENARKVMRTESTSLANKKYVILIDLEAAIAILKSAGIGVKPKKPVKQATT